MGHNLLQCHASDPSQLDSHDNNNGVQPGCSFPVSRGASMRTELGSSLRNSGYPFKRNPTMGRPNGVGDVSLNGCPKEEMDVDGNRDSLHLLFKSRGLAGRGYKMGPVGAKSRSCIYSILISVVICCFLAEAMLQGSVMMLLKRTDILLEIRSNKPIHSRDVGSPEGYALEYKLQFVPWKLEERLKQKMSIANQQKLSQSALRPPRIALVCSNLEPTPESIYLITLAMMIQGLGYKLQLYTLENGPMQAAWVKEGVPVSLLHFDSLHGLNVDWSNFEGVILISLSIKQALSSLTQDPFKEVPVVWIILENTVGERLSVYEATGFKHIISEWKQAFERADVVVFPDYTLAMLYSLLDTGNFYVIPGSPMDLWEVEQYKAMHNREEVRASFNLRREDVVIVVVGSPFTYKGVWREHAMIIRAVLPLAQHFENNGREFVGSLRLFFLTGNSTSGYGLALQVIARQLGFKNGSVSHFGTDKEYNDLLWASDIVLYSSLRNEQSFPSILIKAMSFERLILAPNITCFESNMVDGVTGLLFPPGHIEGITRTISSVISNHDHEFIQKVAYQGRLHVESLFVAEALVEYAKLLEAIIQFPSETHLPFPISHVPQVFRKNWQWQLLQDSDGAWDWKKSVSVEALATSSLVYELEQQMNKTAGPSVESQSMQKEDNDWISTSEWELEKATQASDDLERREEEELEERRAQSRGTWEDVYRMVKKVERFKDELHERDDGELERTGQPLCIYEPYNGVGTWAFLHQNNALYRGISLSLRQRRSGFDDIDAVARLPLLNDSYYQNVLCEYGAFLAIANRIDRIHKNAWIGFQPWQATGRKVSLSTKAEKLLGDAVRLGKDGDAVYFWARMDAHDRENLGNVQNSQDFWSFCDAINNNNCRSVFLDAFKQMYGLPKSWMSLPPMPLDGGTWAVLHCWAMPTSSFLEFVMFTRMFVDALDSQHYIEHHDQGKCCLGISMFEVKHCYCKLLELLVNVWAYHSARKVVYIDPNTGSMHEQHSLNARLGNMWIRFFNQSTLKVMDEDLAEEVDEEHPTRRWLWPHTGEVFYQGIFEKERRERYFQRMERKRKNKERLERIRSRYKQKPLAGG